MDGKCGDIQSLLPWLVNGSLEPEEKLTVFNHLSFCPLCRKELALLYSIRDCAANNAASIDTETSALILSSIKSAIEEVSPGFGLASNISRDIIDRLAADPTPSGIVNCVFEGIKSSMLTGMNAVVKRLEPVEECYRLLGALVAKCI